MTYHQNNGRYRGAAAIRMEANRDANTILADLQTAFASFREANDARLQAVESRTADVVQNEQVDRINASITALQAELDQVNQRAAVYRLGGGAQDSVSAEMRAYAQGFDRYFRRGEEANLRDLAVRASLSTQSNPDGGFFVPDQMESQITRVLGVVSAMRSASRVINVSSPVYKKLVSKGGAVSGWAGEKSARPETTAPNLSELSFPAHEIYAMPLSTQTLLEDSTVDIGQWLADEVSISFAEAESAAFISGNGVTQPRGILSYDTVANASHAWGQIGFIKTGVAATIFDGSNNGVDALISLVYALKQGYRANASFIMNRNVAALYRTLKDSNGNYLWQPSVQAGQPSTLLGYPVLDDDNMSDVGANAFPVAFGDFQRGYLIVDRRGVQVLRDPYSSKPYVAFYTTKRLGGGVQDFHAIKLLKCAA